MNTILELLFFISLIAVLINHILYPLIMLILRSFRKPLYRWKGDDSALPEVHIIFAAHNEESVIEDKIRSSFKSDYPRDKISVSVGSDSSSDQTEEIIRQLQKEFPRLNLYRFESRQGKASILNALYEKVESPYLILTDANILFRKNTIRELVSSIHGAEKTAAVGGNIEYKKVYRKGISAQENFYLRLENAVKTAESRVFGTAMGLEGGCYIIRRELFPPIPPLTYMEDFYVSLSLLEKGYEVHFNDAAICYEDVSIANTQEFRRKKRISIGNFQNLSRFKSLLWKKPFPVGFVFFNHKILRWFTPLFLILLFITSIILTRDHEHFNIFAGLYCIFIAVGLFGILFARSKMASWLKYPGHFMYMNIALLWGMIIYMRGVKSNIWQPTQRNQKE